MAGPVEVILHVGAHRTGTTSLQSWLLQNADTLEAAGIAVWGPDRTRGGLFAGLMKRPDAVTLADDLLARRSATRIRDELDRLAGAGMRQLIVSEENMIGTMPICLEHATIYPDARARLDRIAAAFDGAVTGVGLALRSYDDWWASVLATATGSGGGVTQPDVLHRLARHPRGWQRIIATLAEAFPDARRIVWPFEALVGRHGAQLRLLTGGAALPAAGLYDERRARNARLRALPGGSAADAGARVPFAPAQRAALRARYEQDLAWLRAGAAGVIYTETVAESPGTQVGTAAEEEGPPHDEQKRGLG
ncbi:hypothetical protein [Pontitalea aquivivens]|uniref:hypothetical protein n=1 Tax=Pontitalea aquivivens TaxID=3388663 RepID=UPI0039710317